MSAETIDSRVEAVARFTPTNSDTETLPLTLHAEQLVPCGDSTSERMDRFEAARMALRIVVGSLADHFHPEGGELYLSVTWHRSFPTQIPHGARDEVEASVTMPFMEDKEHMHARVVATVGSILRSLGRLWPGGDL